ncbi:OmpA family protein [Roseibacillus ishigakijimensis]|uniref:OmpA family protein n=1 Tax=Roseibacillus ishigakijimensis TaxID=454146 RepID=A0A934RPV5_9BACT|nr:OmpA family protein [Roseibacillus ishigakijimensis]MBK1832914.1 OmpA family protein [Roseibacillus ishigakijimensis]
MKRAFILLATANLAWGQEAAVTPKEEVTGANIGIVPIGEYEKAAAEIDRLRSELDQALQGKAGAQRALEKQGETAVNVAELRQQLQAARQKAAQALRASEQEQNEFAAREKQLAAKVNKIEADRAKVDADFERRLAGLQAEFGQQKGKWEGQLAEVEKERDAAQRKLEESELTRVRDNEAWRKAVADWRQKAEKALRTAQVREAQTAVANTARLAKEWQSERSQLEEKVVALGEQVSGLEKELGVSQEKAAQVVTLQQNLQEKSRALAEIGAESARLAEVWKKERAETQSELEKLRQQNATSAEELQQRDQRMAELEKSLADKDAALNSLAAEAEQLAKNWTEQRGGLQKTIDQLEAKVSGLDQKLTQAVERERLAIKNGQKANQEISTKLATQVALAAKLKQDLGAVQESEKGLKGKLAELQGELDRLKSEVSDYRSQKEADAQALAALKEELKELKAHHAETEKELAQTTESLAAAKAEAEKLKARTQELESQLATTREQLNQARQEARTHAGAKEEVARKSAQINHLETQLGRLTVAQQELEGTLLTTMGDFEKLQKSYLELQAKSGGEAKGAQEAIARRKEAEAELEKLREKLRVEEEKLKKARQQVEEVEKEKEDAEQDAAKGKAALGKLETELQKARRELGDLQLGQSQLTREVTALRERFLSIEPVRYQLASADVVAQQQRVLAEVRQILEVYPETHFAIKGHTCNLGSKEGNQKLSEQRAAGLRDFLVAAGLAETLFTEVRGCGDNEPEASNESEQGRRQNRRVEITVQPTPQG